MSGKGSAWVAAVAAAVSMAASQSASAHGIPIDTEGSWKTAGAACSPCELTLNFEIDAGSGLTNKVFAYDNGLISIGHPFSTVPTLTPGAPVVEPQAFVSAFYDTTPGWDVLPTKDFFRASEDDVIFPIHMADGSGLITFAAAEFRPAAGNPGAFTLTWAVGSEAVDPDDVSLTFDPQDLADYKLGYPLLGYQFGPLISYADANGVKYDDGSSVYFNLGGPRPVPEPATWAELTLGLLAVGALARASRRTPKPV